MIVLRYLTLTSYVIGVTLSINNIDQYSNIIEAIDNGLNYILRHPYNFNVDGLFGITFALCNFAAITKKIENNRVLIDLEAKSQRVYDTIYPLLETVGSDEIFRQTLLKPDSLDKHINFVSGVLDENYDRVPIHDYWDFVVYYEAASINESHIDKCIVELITDQRENNECPISDDCYDFMIVGTPKDSGYVISHELLYLIIARMQKCVITDLKTYNDKIKYYCNVMLFEVRTMAKIRYPRRFKDLFLEHITLCGYSGFTEFFEKDYIDSVLSMQSSDGCFNSIAFRNGRRVKRKMNMDQNGCFDHTNGLGISTLSMYLRYVLINS